MEFSATIYKLGECRRRQIPLKPAWALTVRSALTLCASLCSWSQKPERRPLRSASQASTLLSLSLILALSLPHAASQIHKCQGMTVDCAKVSLDNLFAEGAHREGHALRAPAPPRSRGLFLFVRGGDFLADTGAAVVSVGLRRASVRRAVPRALA